MKKLLLIVALLISGKAFSQNFTQSNEASIGSSTSMYICDSLTDNYASVKGSSTVWDFTNLVIPDTNKRTLLSVIDPNSTIYKLLYTTSNKAIVLENYLTSYFSSTNTERNCLGYFFSTKDLGDVRAVFNVDPEVTHAYPFGLNSSKKDNLIGSLLYTYNGVPINATATGSSFAEVDALGTLKIDAAKVFSNVLRYHIKDSINATVTLPFVGTVDATLKRDQFEYYDFTISNLPIYTHSNLTAYVYKISADPLVNKTLVLSKYKGDKNAKPVDPTNSLTQLENVKYSIYPNPVNNIIYVIGEDLTNTVISIIDQAGKIVKTFTNTNELPIESLEKGMYFIQISTMSGSTTLKFQKE